MSDQCKHCEYVGDIKACLSVECFQHESWYAKKQQATIDRLNIELDDKIDTIEILKGQCAGAVFDYRRIKAYLDATTKEDK